MTAPIQATVDRWHELLRSGSMDGLDDLLADDVVFLSPIVFTPQEGKELTKLYLHGAFASFGGDPDSASDGPLESSDGGGSGSFRYVKEVVAGNHAVLEFETTVEGTLVNGVDIITVNDEGRIVEFKVMLRPLKAINLMHQIMGRALDRLSAD